MNATMNKTTNLAIKLEGLSKRYQGFGKRTVDAVKDVSLIVDQGEVFGFIGANGAGKSTTIKMLTGVVQASAGSASIFGVSIDRPAARRGVGYVPENPYLYDYLTPLEILTMGMELHGVRVDNQYTHCLGWLERLELGSVANTRIRSFSKGMTQRVALAQALCLKPQLLILDEPLSGLDPVGRRDVVDILAEYKREGGTVFLTSHVLHDVERLADRFGLIHQGEIKMVKSPNDLVGGQQIVTVRTVGKAPVDGMKQDSGDCWHAEVARDHLWQLLKKLEAAGHSIVEVKQSLTLESAFMQYVQTAS
jgi:ABC-2 type transport system ATP-binding protein